VKQESPVKPVLRLTGECQIDDDILEAFRQKGDAEGKGYQTMINQTLREYLDQAKPPLDEDTLRRIFQEELRAVTFVSSV
jgi:BrnA antitoxin of type II toxin-antitoxin system